VFDQDMSESTELTPESNITTITVHANGPYEVQGELVVCGADGRTLREGKRMYLCRCGHSANKPFCDGTHTKIGFSDEGLGVKKDES
jgi:CDGSH-type Zn-finger protein